VRARLEKMKTGESFTFICLLKMAEKINRVVTLASGAIDNWNEREYGVVISVHKV
jgi:hypothetical protein